MQWSTITREELYELVWSMPMTRASKQLCVSDVMLGRVCREREVPCPPRGYWAALRSEKKRSQYVQPPLPNHAVSAHKFHDFLLEQKDRQNADRPEDFDPQNLAEPIPPPPEAFAISIKEYRHSIEQALPELLEPNQITTLHPTVQKVYEYDLRVAAERRRGHWGQTTQYQGDKGKLQLQLLNTFVQLFDQMGFKVEVSGRKYFHFSVEICGWFRQFHVFLQHHNPRPTRNKRTDEKPPTRYCFSWSREPELRRYSEPYYQFDELTADCVRSVIVDLAIKAEENYREGVFSSYERNVEARKNAIKRQAMLEVQAAERRRKALEKLLSMRVDLMGGAVRDMNHSDQVRSLIAILQEKSANARRPVEGLDGWVSWATHHANMIDPRHMSVKGIEAWIKQFRLKD
jgi:hypothetical protein